MPTPDELRTDFNTVVDDNGLPCLITNYTTQTFNSSGYDDEQLPSISGTAVSGGCIIQPIGPSDKQYVERGVVLWNDTKMFIAGSLNISANSTVVVGNTGSMYQVLPQGIVRHDVSGATVFQEVYLRQIASGQHAGVV